MSVDAQSNTANAACASAVPRAEALDPFIGGQMAALRIETRPSTIADWAFQTGDGQPLSMADFEGRVVLLNLWATWCGPCVAEMPALNALAEEMGGDDFEVVAVSLDSRNTPEAPQAFLEEYGIDALDLYVDPSTSLLSKLRLLGVNVPGLPTTILVDEEGCVLALMQAPAEWDGPDARRLIAAALGED